MTQQLSLLNQPRARKNDRATSKAAASSVQHVSGLLETLICSTLAGTKQPLTAEVIARAIEHGNPGRWDEGTIRSAVSRAAKRCLIVEAGEGKTSRGWATTWKTAP